MTIPKTITSNPATHQYHATSVASQMTPEPEWSSTQSLTAARCTACERLGALPSSADAAPRSTPRACRGTPASRAAYGAPLC